jgi:hypothetical protein
MESSATGVIIMQCTRLLKEAFEGPPGPWSYFTDRSPGAGLFGTIDRLNAAAASRTSRAGGTACSPWPNGMEPSLRRS